MAKDHAQIGPALWQRFNTKNADDPFWYYESLTTTFEQTHTAPTLVSELRTTIAYLRAHNET